MLLGRKSTPRGFAPPRNAIWDNVKIVFFLKNFDTNFRQWFFHHFDSETVQCMKSSEYKEILLKNDSGRILGDRDQNMRKTTDES